MFALVAAPAASAATRYAAPLGTGVDPCENPAEPCNIYVAADSSAPDTTIEPGDVVELAPGTYSEAAGDLGPFNYVAVQEVTVRGEPGQPRPLIRLQSDLSNTGAFQIFEGALVAHVEIENEAEGGFGVSVSEGTLDGTIVRAPSSPSITCEITAGVVRNSVCLNEGAGVALGASIGTGPGTFTTTIRSTTAIASGFGSRGVEFFYGATDEGLVANIDAKGLIAKGEAKDVVARGRETSGSGKGATVVISLDHSDYATVETETSGTGGSASITPAGTSANITAAPLLASDHIHQLAGSPTINKGAVDGQSSSVDIDGQQRTIGPAPDIGADELGNPTSTRVACAPSSVAPGGGSTCTATVEDLGTVLTQPGGDVSFGSAGSCTLVPVNEASSRCAVNLSGLTVTQTVTAVYEGGPGHEGSEGSAQITVTAAGGGSDGSGSGSGGGGAQGGSNPGSPKPVNHPPVTQLKKHPASRTAAHKAKFTFSANEADSHFECKLDRKSFKPCSSPFKKKVGLGSHKFKVRAVDPQGLADPTPVVFSWRVVQPG
ncbi:MAG TPA: choice-of-anchor Q domain-containing protein [Solirubrobacterales bacterium]|nr:choice-of-anchor Q domain-containing protein [Solirubrobacterales bacterium]